jgi:hypothetical protein
MMPYFITVPLHSESPLRYDYPLPKLRTPAPLTLRGNNSRIGALAGLHLRFVLPLRSAPLPTIALVIVFLLYGAKKGNENLRLTYPDPN